MTHSLRCFLIDDDIDDQKIFSIISEEVDSTIKCSFANDGVDAIEKLTTCEVVPDLIFLDVNMPRMDGLECLRKIKKIDRLKNIPVYMYSTTADPTTVTLTKRLGVKDFIVKPNNINELVNILTNIYSQHRMQAGSV
jgi:CheY-like chemotaxis protein